MDLRDQYGRTFKTLRVSVIDTCNLSCIYCTCGNEELKDNYQQSKNSSLPAAQLLRIIQDLHQELTLETIRFTGGEPLLYKDLPDLVKGVKDLGINDLKLTTNGVLLDKLAPALKQAGLNSINVSLDAIDEEAFYRISRRSNIGRILKGIDIARSEGIEVKLNSVVMQDVNEDQIIPLLKFAFERGLVIRFLEIMSMGHLFGKADQHFFSQENILSEISGHYNFQRLARKASSTANYWQTNEGNVFGIVANESEPFCSDCNRLRLDSHGNIYGCLSSNSPISVKEIRNQEELRFKLKAALEQKQSLKFTGSKLSMLHIGG